MTISSCMLLSMLALMAGPTPPPGPAPDAPALPLHDPPLPPEEVLDFPSPAEVDPLSLVLFEIPAPPAPELRELLENLRLRRMEEQLRLSERQSREVRPLLESMLRARQAYEEARRASLLELRDLVLEQEDLRRRQEALREERRAAPTPESLRDEVFRALEQELQQTIETYREARLRMREILDQLEEELEGNLDSHQKARYLLLEAQFEREVLELVRAALSPVPRESLPAPPRLSLPDLPVPEEPAPAPEH